MDYLREIKEGVDSGKAVAMQAPNLPSHLSNLLANMSRLFASVSNSNTAIVLVTILRLKPLLFNCLYFILVKSCMARRLPFSVLFIVAAITNKNRKGSPTALSMEYPCVCLSVCVSETIQ